MTFNASFINALINEGAHFEKDKLCWFEDSHKEIQKVTQKSQALKCPRLDLGIIAIKGATACQFLQGQCTADVNKINDEQAILTGLCNRQGRLVNLGILFKGQQQYYFVVQRETIEATLAFLKPYALLSRMILEDVSNMMALSVYQPNKTPQPAYKITEQQGVYHLSLPGKQYPSELIIGDNAPIIEVWQHCNACPISPNAWQFISITEGFAQITAKTQQSFLPHDINLPALKAVSFAKGCYLGQEIIARMEHLGKAKKQLNVLTTDRFYENGDKIIDPKTDKVLGEAVNQCKVDDSNYLTLAVVKD